MQQVRYPLNLQESEPLPDTKLCKSRDTVDVELVHGLLATGLDRFNADIEFGGDFFSRFALGDQPKHLKFSLGQPSALKNRFLSRFLRFSFDCARLRDGRTQTHFPVACRI